MSADVLGGNSDYLNQHRNIVAHLLELSQCCFHCLEWTAWVINSVTSLMLDSFTAPVFWSRVDFVFFLFCLIGWPWFNNRIMLINNKTDTKRKSTNCHCKNLYVTSPVLIQMQSNCIMYTTACEKIDDENSCRQSSILLICIAAAAAAITSSTAAHNDSAPDD